MDLMPMHDDTHGTAGATCPMIMIFHAGHCERILWKGWVASTVPQFVLSALAIFVTAFLYEALKFVRELYLRRTLRLEAASQCLHNNSSNNESSLTQLNIGLQQKTYFQRVFNFPHIVQALLNLIQLWLSYVLMLVFMNYNYYLCLALVLGLGFGYFCFGWIKNVTYTDECCH